MPCDVTVITPSRVDRVTMLLRAMRTVQTQTVGPVTHLIGIDQAQRGPAVIRNELLAAVSTEWVAFLDDDDLLKPNHLETLLAASDGMDVVGAYCDFDGPSLPAQFCNQPYDRRLLRRHGIFPITVIARTAAVRAHGCFGAERYEDWELWNRMANGGCQFRIVPEVTWTYRTGHHDRRTNVA